MNARFILNGQGDPHILMHEFKLHEAIYNIFRFDILHQKPSKQGKQIKYQLYSNKDQEMLGFEIYYLHIRFSKMCFCIF